MVAPKFRSGRNRNTLSASERVAVAPLTPDSTFGIVGGLNCPLETEPMLLAASGAEQIHSDLRAEAAIHAGEFNLEQDLRLRLRDVHIQQVDGLPQGRRDRIGALRA